MLAVQRTMNHYTYSNWESVLSPLMHSY